MVFKLLVLYYYLGFLISRRNLYSRAHLDVLQRARLKRFRGHLKKSPYYKSFDSAAFSELPLMNKQLFMDNFNRINTKDIDRESAAIVAMRAESSRDFKPMVSGVTVGLSSGTSGNKGLFLVGKTESARWVAAVLDRVIGFSFKPRKVAFFLRANSNLYESVKSGLLEFQYYDIRIPVNDLVVPLCRYKPNIVIGPPSVLVDVIHSTHFRQYPFYPTQVISVAEVLDDLDRTALEQAFQTSISEVYQCTEGFLASTCENGKLHFNEDWLMIEKKFIDAEHKRYHPVITDLLRTTQPVVRYELNDIIHEGVCTCGRVTAVIDHIEGRSDDAFCFENRQGQSVKIYPDFIRNAIISSSDNIIDFKVVQRSRYEVLLQLKTSNQDELLKDEDCAIASLDHLFLCYNIDYVKISTAVLDEPRTNKLRRVFNESKATI